mgnify:CR=1 FL=1
MNRLGKYGGVSYLLLLIVVLPLAVWRLSLARTFDRWQEIRRSERTIATLSADSSAIETIRFRFDTTELIAGGGLLDRINRYTTGMGVSVVRYTPYLTRSDEEFALRTAEVILSGRFVSLVRTLDRIEREIPSCKVVSTAFQTVKRRQEKRLQLILLVQQLTETP